MKKGINNNYGTANFIFNLSDCYRFLFIHDLCLENAMSVTNDIRNVLQSLIDKGYDLHKYKVIYKDSSFIYDAILINPDNTFHSFASLNQFTPETAMSRYDERIKNHSLI